MQNKGFRNAKKTLIIAIVIFSIVLFCMPICAVIMKFQPSNNKKEQTANVTVTGFNLANAKYIKEADWGGVYWLNEKYAKQVEVRTFENLLAENEEGSTNERAVADSFNINPNSLKVTQNAFVEDGVNYTLEERYQFVWNGYFALDKDSTEDKLVFNRTITLKETKKAKI